MSNKLLKILLFASLIVPGTVFAQLNINLPYALSNELGVETIPKYPKPNDTIFINLTLYTDDLDSATIDWYKDDKKVLSGVGEKKYYFKTGNVGEKTNIKINIKLLNGVSFSKEITINPSDVDIIWESLSYVPPFYKGKALHPRQGFLKLVAVPNFVVNGKTLSPQNLVYKWSNEVEAYEDQSGYGKNVLFLNGSLLGKSEEIELMVTDPVSNTTARRFISISPSNPKLIFYENSPYYGHLFDLAVKDIFDLKSEEVQFMASPYFFSRENVELDYKWRLNGTANPSLDGSRTAIFKKPEDKGGVSNISLEVSNPKRVLQFANTSATVRFNK